MDEYKRRRRRSRAVMSMFLDSLGGIIDDVDVAEFDSDGSDLKALIVGIELVQSGTGDPSPDNVRPITGHSSVNVIVSPTLNPLDGTITNIPLGQTVYGGTLDVLTGVLTVKMVIVDLGALTWSAASTVGTNKRMVSIGLLNVIKPPPTSSIKADIICETYPTITADQVYTEHLGISANSSGTLSAYDPDLQTASDFKTAMDGVQLVYELATPQTIQLTGQQIATFLGTNHVWCDSGKIIHLEY